MAALSIAEALLYSVIRITAYNGTSPLSYGTGFLFNASLSGDRSVICLMTNKHVVKDADSVEVSLHRADPTADLKEKPQPVTIRINLPGSVIDHPEDEVDLCAINVSAEVEAYRKAGTPLYIMAANEGDIPKIGEWGSFDAIEEVVMIGCPNGIYDEVSKLPIARRGITATPLVNNYGGNAEFMVDMACFPGSSGSPIFVYNRDGYLDRATNTLNMGSARIRLVGVLYSGPQIDARGHITMAAPSTVSVKNMMHLGLALKASRVLELADVIRQIFSQPPKPLDFSGNPFGTGNFNFSLSAAITQREPEPPQEA